MQFVSDPPIATKIQKMKQRVLWKSAPLVDRNIDQTRFVLDDGRNTDSAFSFLVIGDSGTGSHLRHDPQRRIAEMMIPHYEECRFMLHTGDVVYLVGSSEYYFKNFIDPYRECLVGGDKPHRIRYDRMVFQLPILPVLGNHDYYDLPILYGVAAQLSWPLRRLLRAKLDLDVGWHGSDQGDAFAKAFLDYLVAKASGNELNQHLDRYYTAETDTGRCLRYQPKHFTRLPNRYYTFRYGGIDFFALDSNTFNAPIPLSNTEGGDEYRRELLQKRAAIEQERQELIKRSLALNPDQAKEAEELDDAKAKIEYLGEIEQDIKKQLEATRFTPVDQEQLDWLQQRLIQSWADQSVRGRILFFHHPPYVTEATKWSQAQTAAVRDRLRQVLDGVAKQVGDRPQGRPLVDLVINGHAHCFDYLQTVDTEHGDSHMHWLVCGGSGYSLRRQRQEGPELMEISTENRKETSRLIAKSSLFVGRTGSGTEKRRPYSFLRIDVQPGEPLTFVVRPFVTERYRGQWLEKELPSVQIRP